MPDPYTWNGPPLPVHSGAPIGDVAGAIPQYYEKMMLQLQQEPLYPNKDNFPVASGMTKEQKALADLIRALMIAGPRFSAGPGGKSGPTSGELNSGVNALKKNKRRGGDSVSQADRILGQ